METQEPVDPAPYIELAPAVPVPASYSDRLKSLLDKTGFIDDVCSNIANGGDYITFCAMMDIRYSDLHNWLNEGKGRGEALAKAERARMEWVRNRILNELRILAMTDLREAFTADGELLPPSKWPDSVARALAGVETEELFEGVGRDRERIGNTKKIKLYNKIEALKLIGQEFGLFIQKHQVAVTDKLEDLVAQSFITEPPVQ